MLWAWILMWRGPLNCYQEHVQTPDLVIIWGCVSTLGKYKLHLCDSSINAEKYFKYILFTFQQNEVKPHAVQKSVAVEKAITGTGLT